MLFDRSPMTENSTGYGVLLRDAICLQKVIDVDNKYSLLLFCSYF